MTKYFFLFAIAFSLLFACAQKETVPEQEPVIGEDLDAATIDKINELELRLGNTDIIEDTEAAAELVQIMKGVSSARRGNIELPGKIRQAAEAAMFINEYQDAITLFNNLYQNYPDHTLAPFALFHIGFIHDEYIGDKATALKYYDTFLKKYPKHDYVKSINELKLYIENTPLEVFEILKERGQEYIPEDSDQKEAAKQ
jgi:tetratricopeptide (TPR) repeat protein